MRIWPSSTRIFDLKTHFCSETLSASRPPDQSNGQPVESRPLRLQDLVPSVGQDAQIDVAPLSPDVIRAITTDVPNSPGENSAAMSMFSFNHIQSVWRTFVKSTLRPSKNKYQDLHPVLHAHPGIESSKLSLPGSEATCSSALKQFTTGIKNIYAGNILYKLTTRLLRKLFLHEFAPIRTARHLEYLGKKKQFRPPTARTRRKTIKCKIKNAQARLYKAEATCNDGKVKRLRVNILVIVT
jgi:hypothetical protein